MRFTYKRLDRLLPCAFHPMVHPSLLKFVPITAHKVPHNVRCPSPAWIESKCKRYVAGPLGHKSLVSDDFTNFILWDVKFDQIFQKVLSTLASYYPG